MQARAATPTTTPAQAKAPAQTKAPAQKGFFERMASAEEPGSAENRFFSEEDRESIEAIFERGRRQAQEVEEIEDVLHKMADEGENMEAQEILGDKSRYFRRRHSKALRGAYMEVADYLNDTYGTDFPSHFLFQGAYEEDTFSSRKVEGRSEEENEEIREAGDPVSFLTLEEAEAHVESYLEEMGSGSQGLKGAGEEAVVRNFRREMRRALRGAGPTIGKSHIHFKSAFGRGIDVEKVNRLLNMLYFFETGQAQQDVPDLFFGWLRPSGNSHERRHRKTLKGRKVGAYPTSTGEENQGSFPRWRDPEETGIEGVPGERIEALRTYENGSLRVYFTSGEARRDFAVAVGID